MAYFNHAFNKTFLSTGPTGTFNVTDPVTGQVVSATTADGYLTTTGLPTYVLNGLSQLQEQFPYSSPTDLSTWSSGFVGIFGTQGANANLSITPTQCCNIYIAGSAIYNNDKIGPFHGGYTETNKSKMINPKYVQKFYHVAPCPPQNMVVHVGSTYGTLGGGVSSGAISTPGAGYTDTATPVEVQTVTTSGTGTGLTLFVTIAAGVPTVTGIASLGKGYAVGDTVELLDITGLAAATPAVYTVNGVNGAVAPTIPGTECCKEFLCGETYYLRVDIKGSPALRFLNHNAYYNAEAYTGCCPAGSIAPTPVDSTEVMILWANALLRYRLTAPFLQIIIQDEAGVLWYQPGTSAAELAALGGNTWDNYVSPGHTAGACAGLILNGAYVDTKFGDCTFQVTDFFEKQPVKIFASEVDLNGDPCVFEGICVANECEGLQVQGLGEQVLRDLIVSESYRQNFFASNDLRIREITQGNQLVSAINRNALYHKTYLLHSVPRFNNPTGVFDNDRYLLEIVSFNQLVQFEQDILSWLSGCNVDCVYEDFTCQTTCSAVTFPNVVTKGY